MPMLWPESQNPSNQNPQPQTVFLLQVRNGKGGRWKTLGRLNEPHVLGVGYATYAEREELVRNLKNQGFIDVLPPCLSRIPDEPQNSL